MKKWSRITVQGSVAAILLMLLSGICIAQDLTEGLKIGSLDTAGNITINRSRILARVRSRVGENFSRETASKDAERIAEIDGVEYSYYNTAVENGEVNLTFVVVEKNLIRQIVFEGNKAYKRGKLLKETGLEEGNYLDSFEVKNGVERITDVYRQKGYAHVKVSLDEEALELGRVVYNIDEGPRVKVSEINFRGNSAIKDSELARGINTKKRKYIVFQGYYDQDVLEKDIIRLKEAYQKKGYMNVKIDSDVTFNEKGDKAAITFDIEEGKIYHIGEVAITGNEFFEDSVLSEKMRIRPGGIYSEEYAEYDASRIASKYHEIGFVDAKVEQRRFFSEDDNTISVEFNVYEGGRYKIGEIDIVGNHEVHGKVIRSILDEEDFYPGQWYNADIARGNGTGDLEQLVNRKAMSQDATIRPKESEGEYRDAQVNITESQTGSIMLGAGVNSNRGLVGQLVLNQRNFDIFDWPMSFEEFITGNSFKGAGQQFRISLNPGTQQSSFAVSFLESNLYDKPVSLDVGFTGFERMQETYDEERIKGYVGLEKRYRNDWRRGIAFRAENVGVEDIDFDAPQEVKDDAGDSNLFGTKLFIRKDTTDSRFLPTRGYNFTASYEQVVGDYNFGVLSGTQRWYNTVYEDLGGRRTVLSAKLHGATIVGGDAPVYEKFYAGGTGSLRGFDYRGVSTRGLSTGPAPNEFDDPIGSDWLVTGNLELSVPITSEILSWLVFVDGGTIDQGGIRASVGTGVQVLLPQWFGPVPMRLEFATPFMKDDLDDTQFFSFSVGALF